MKMKDIYHILDRTRKAVVVVQSCEVLILLLKSLLELASVVSRYLYASRPQCVDWSNGAFFLITPTSSKGVKCFKCLERLQLFMHSHQPDCRMPPPVDQKQPLTHSFPSI